MKRFWITILLITLIVPMMLVVGVLGLYARAQAQRSEPLLRERDLVARPQEVPDLPLRATAGEQTVRDDVGESRLEDLRRKATLSEMRSIERANVIRERLKQWEGVGDAEVKKALRAELRTLVVEAFKARQKLHAVEVASLEWKAQAMKKSLAEREAHSSEIIDRRVDELLNPDMKWDSGETKVSGADVRFYDIQDLPLWSRDGTSLQADLLILYLEPRVDSTKNGGDTIGTYDAGRGVLVVRGDARKHQQIAQLLADLRASSGQPAEDFAKTESQVISYSIADLPLWSKDGKKQSADLLMSYLRFNVDPLSWESKATRAAYDAKALSLVILATPEVQEKIQKELLQLRAKLDFHWREYGVTSAPVTELTAKVLESIGLHLCPITNDSFREKNVFAGYSGGLDLTYVQTGGTAQKAGIHEEDIIVKLQGRLVTRLSDLDSAIQQVAEQIERKDADSLQFDVLRRGETVRVNVPFPRVSSQSTNNNAESRTGLKLNPVLPRNSTSLKNASPESTNVGETESRFYDIRDLPIWDRDGRTQQIDLLCHYLGLDTDETKAIHVPFGSYDAGRMLLRVRASTAKLRQIGQLLSDLRANAGPATVALASREWLNANLKAESLRVYSIADVALWSKDGKKQDVDLLLRYLRSIVDPPTWDSQVTRAAYDAEKLQLVVQATPEVHNQIAAALSPPLPVPVMADGASIIACTGPQAPIRLGAVIAHEDVNKGLDHNVVRLHVWDWSKSNISRVMLIQKSELGVLSHDGTTMLTFEGESLDLASRATRQYSGFRVNDDQVIFSMRLSPSGKYVAAMIRARTPIESDLKNTPTLGTWTLRLLELDAATNTGKQIGEFPAYANAGVAFSSDESSVTYTSEKQRIIRRDVASGIILGEYQPPGSVHQIVGIAVSPDGRWIAAAQSHGRICVWETQSGKLLVDHQTLRDNDANDVSFQAKVMRFSLDGAHLAVVSGNHLQVMETESGNIVKKHEHEATPPFAQVRWSHDGKTITLLTSFQPTNFVDKVGVALHPTANIFPRVFEWNWREGSPVLKPFGHVPEKQTRVSKG